MQRLCCQLAIFAPCLLDNPVFAKGFGEVQQVPLDFGQHLPVHINREVQAVDGEDFFAKFGAGGADIRDAGFGDLIIDDALRDKATLEDTDRLVVAVRIVTGAAFADVDVVRDRKNLLADGLGEEV